MQLRQQPPHRCQETQDTVRLAHSLEQRVGRYVQLGIKKYLFLFFGGGDDDDGDDGDDDGDDDNDDDGDDDDDDDDDVDDDDDDNDICDIYYTSHHLFTI